LNSVPVLGWEHSGALVILFFTRAKSPNPRGRYSAGGGGGKEINLRSRGRGKREGSKTGVPIFKLNTNSKRRVQGGRGFGIVNWRLNTSSGRREKGLGMILTTGFPVMLETAKGARRKTWMQSVKRTGELCFVRREGL